jgi:cytoskeletal protein CcmA (bactofilin family)
MFGKSKKNTAANMPAPSSSEEREMVEILTQINRDPAPAEDHEILAPMRLPETPEASSSISSGLSIFGKIVGNGRLAIFGRVEGEIEASAVQIGDGAQIDGNIVADELTIGGRVKGTIHANRVKLNSTAVIEGDIYHRSLIIEENARFEGTSRRQENVIDTPSLTPANLPQKRAVSTNVNGGGNGASDPLNP